jgi:hypothetical protein
MKEDRCCIIQSFDRAKDKPSIHEVVKVFYKGKYIAKYSKLIDKDRLYPIDEANEILKNNSTYRFVIATRNNYNKGADMIEELACLEERAELNFEVINWNTIEEYIKEIEKQGYKSEKFTEKEFEEWLKWKYPEK